MNHRRYAGWMQSAGRGTERAHLAPRTGRGETAHSPLFVGKDATPAEDAPPPAPTFRKACPVFLCAYVEGRGSVDFDLYAMKAWR